MLTMKKQNDKALRFKYIKVLEKFVKRTIALVKDKEFNHEIFKEKVNKYYEEVEKIESVRLDSQYMIKLKEYAQMTLNFVDNHSKDKSFEKEREILLKEANLLHKEKNKSNYKKDKHKKKSFTDGY